MAKRVLSMGSLPQIQLVFQHSAAAVRQLHSTAIAQHGLYPYFNKHKKVTDPARQDPAYFEKEAAKLPIDEHYIDALKKLWEEKIGSERELIFKAQDSLIGNTTDFGLPKLDMSAPRLEYREVDILKTAPESVQRIFSLEHGERSDITAAWKNAMVDSVKRDNVDVNSLPAKIAWATATIRHWTALFEDLMKCRKRPRHKLQRRPTWILFRAYFLINFRRKMLRLLREQDRNEFERVVRELRIAYIVEKEPEHVKTRKAWSEAQLLIRVKEEKERRLAALHEKLKEGREERTAQIDAETANLEKEAIEIRAKLKELSVFEGKEVANVAGIYSPNYVEELGEIAENTELFYRPPPPS